MRYWELLVQSLLRDPALKLGDRSLYLLIYEWQPESMRELAILAGASRNALRSACSRLVQARWLRLERVGHGREQLRPVALVPPQYQAVQLRQLQLESSMAPNRGEFLMKRQLDLRVRDRAFVDNARPSELEQPSGKRLECDRLYLEAKVGFEYWGHYHHAPPEGAAAKDIEEHLETKTRDLIKVGLSHQAGIRLVHITGADLRFEVFATMIPECLPLRRLDPACLYYRELAHQCASYATYTLRRVQEAGKRGRQIG